MKTTHMLDVSPQFPKEREKSLNQKATYGRGYLKGKAFKLRGSMKIRVKSPSLLETPDARTATY